VSALDRLHRGPDKYDRQALRDRMRTDWPPPSRPLNDWELHEALTAALDRLDDAERLLEERGP
jgi:hypothetical protein